jgi:hypothetical protein
MISSEVQRTLVKSPPELWAELSDPGSLARHLGELGEIRITRVEPEQLVEWEAENRTGTVQIKASGWGTRVTLTVASEVSSATPPAAQPPLVEPEHGAEPSSADAPQPEDEPASQAQESTPGAQDAACTPPQAPAASTWQEEPEPAGPPHSDLAWPGDADPALAAPEIAPVEGQSEPEDEAAEELTEVEMEPVEVEPVDGEGYAWMAYDAPEPRRGFFARLFGRRRRQQDLEPEPSDAIAPIEAPLEQPEFEHGDPPAATSAAPGDLQGLDSPEMDSPVEPVIEPSTADAPSEAEIDPASEAFEASEPAGGEGQTLQAEETPNETRAAAQDISVQLKAAEEIADAEVTALLTSVLDRLGAAHHRPFSRS